MFSAETTVRSTEEFKASEEVNTSKTFDLGLETNVVLTLDQNANFEREAVNVTMKDSNVESNNTSDSISVSTEKNTLIEDLNTTSSQTFFDVNSDENKKTAKVSVTKKSLSLFEDDDNHHAG